MIAAAAMAPVTPAACRPPTRRTRGARRLVDSVPLLHAGRGAEADADRPRPGPEAGQGATTG